MHTELSKFQTAMNICCVPLDEKSDIARAVSKLKQDLESLVTDQKGGREAYQMFGIYYMSKRQREGALRQTKRVRLSANSIKYVNAYHYLGHRRSRERPIASGSLGDCARMYCGASSIEKCSSFYRARTLGSPSLGSRYAL